MKLWESLKTKKETKICEGPEKCIVESEPHRKWLIRQVMKYSTVFIGGTIFGLLCAGLIVNSIYQSYWQGRSTIWLSQDEVQNILDNRTQHAGGDKYKLYEGMKADAKNGKLSIKIEPQKQGN